MNQKDKLELNENEFLKIIDFASHLKYFEVNLNVAPGAKDLEEFFNGDIIYNPTYKPTEPGADTEDIFCDDKLTFLKIPLKSFYDSITLSTESLIPRWSTYKKIFRLRDAATATNKFYDVPLDILADYSAALNAEIDLQTASINFNIWANMVHSTPKYTKEEMENDPIKKEVMEQEYEFETRPQIIRNNNKGSLARVINKMLSMHKSLPKKYDVESLESTVGSVVYEILKVHSELSFVFNTYNSFRLQHRLTDSSEVKEFMYAIDTKLQDLRKLELTNPF